MLTSEWHLKAINKHDVIIINEQKVQHEGEDQMKLCENMWVKERRGVLGISQLDLAEMAGISLATVKDIERGAGNPSMKTVKRILEVLGLEMQFRIRTIE